MGVLKSMADSTLKAAQKLLGKDPRFAHRKLSTTCPRQVTMPKQRKLQRGVSEIAGIIENLKMEYSRLKKEIAADQDGIDDYSGAKGCEAPPAVDFVPLANGPLGHVHLSLR